MRLLILILLVAAVLPSCSDRSTAPEPQTGPGKLVVHIVWNLDEGSAGKFVQVLEAGVEGITDSSGVVEFTLEPGVYTVRAHDLGSPGIAPPTRDVSATVHSSETVSVEFYDCRYCRAR